MLSTDNAVAHARKTLADAIAAESAAAPGNAADVARTVRHLAERQMERSLEARPASAPAAGEDD